MRAIDLFAGAGFMGLGFEQAGFDIVAAVEKDNQAIASHLRNFPHIPVLAADVQEIGKREIYEAAGLALYKDKIDVVIGGPPCQGWSNQGHSNPADPRRSLIDDFLRIVGDVRPKTFVMENVKGLTQGKNRKVLDDLIREFQTAGYDCVEYLLNAKDYGVAQNRERLFLIGSQRNYFLVERPPTLAPVTCRDVLGDIENAVDARRISGWERTAHTAAIAGRFGTVQPGDYDKPSKFKRLHPDGVSPTLTAGTRYGSAKGGRHTPKRPIHYIFDRVVTRREFARLHGVPDWIPLGDDSISTCAALSGIGNSVPPPLAKAVAEMVAAALVLRGV